MAAGKGGAASCVQQDGGATVGRDATKPAQQGCASAEVYIYIIIFLVYTYRNTCKCEDKLTGATRQHAAVALGSLHTNHHSPIASSGHTSGVPSVSLHPDVTGSPSPSLEGA